MKTPTPSELKAAIEAAGTSPHFFTRSTMRCFGDTMKNYGVCGPVSVRTHGGDVVQCWELFRRKAVKYGNKQSAYFSCEGFRRVHGEVQS